MAPSPAPRIPKRSPFRRLSEDLAVKYPDNPFIFVPAIHQAVFVGVLGGGLYLATGSWIGTLLVAFIGLQLILATTAFHVYRTLRRDLEDQQRKLQANLFLQQRIRLRAPLPPMTGWAATPELALCIYQEIMDRRPASIVELGSGISTLICGYALETEGIEGKVLSLDHDEPFAASTRQQLRRHGLEGICEVVSSALAPWTAGSETDKWYALEGIGLPESIDLLIVDGPPVRKGLLTRYPALPELHARLAVASTVILHDTHREEETETVKRWSREYPDFVVTMLDTEKGIAVLRRSVL